MYRCQQLYGTWSSVGMIYEDSELVVRMTLDMDFIIVRRYFGATMKPVRLNGSTQIKDPQRQTN